MWQDNKLKNVVKRNILTEGLKVTYPFLTTRMIDDNGIFIGTSIEDESIIILDRFCKEKYKNSNIAIFGTSDAGKSYFTKLVIIRSFIFYIEQLIIDPEREYKEICEKLNGEYIKLGPKSCNYINIFDIRKEDLEEDIFFDNVIKKVKCFLMLLLGKKYSEKTMPIEDIINKSNEIENIQNLLESNDGNFEIEDVKLELAKVL